MNNLEKQYTNSKEFLENTDHSLLMVETRQNLIKEYNKLYPDITITNESKTFLSNGILSFHKSIVRSYKIRFELGGS